MATDSSYEGIERPYNSFLERTTSEDVALGSNGLSSEASVGATSAKLADTSPTVSGGTENSITANSVVKSGQQLADMFLSNTMQSSNYLPKARGFLIDALRGYIECMSMYVSGDIVIGNATLTGGVIRYGKTSFTDSANAGYYVSPEGIYFGSVADATRVKFDMATGLLDMIGTFASGKTGPYDPTSGFWQGVHGGSYKWIIGDADKQVDWNVSEINQFSVVKGATSIVGNAINIQDLSSDGNAAANIQFYGNNTAKELFRAEMHSTMTNAKTGFSAVKQGGSADSLLNLENEAGAIDELAYMHNTADNGKGLFVWNDHASNADPAAFFRADCPVGTNFYKIMSFGGSTAAELDIYAGNNADPNGVLSGGIGDICISTNGGIYICQNGTIWTSISKGIISQANTATECAWATTYKSGTDTNYVKVKEIKTEYGGTINTVFDLQVSGTPAASAQARIYVNGVAVGTEQTTNDGAWHTFSQDISVNSGDLVQLYAKHQGSFGWAVQNFKLRAVLVPKCTTLLD